jgi:hypothetical protein
MSDKLSDEEIEKRKSALDALHEFGNMFQDAMEQIEKEEESWWSSLTEDQQISALCCVSRRIHKGDIEENGSYRYVLYNVFGFGPEAYARAQMAGYLAIHNAIVTASTERVILERFCKMHGIDNATEKIDSYIEKTYL